MSKQQILLLLSAITFNVKEIPAFPVLHTSIKLQKIHSGTSAASYYCMYYPVLPKSLTSHYHVCANELHTC